MSDFRLALRTLRRTPGYSLTIILTLALGIGGATAVASVLRSVIIRPLPYAPADRVMLLTERDSAANLRLPSYLTFKDWQDGTDVFEAMAFARGLGTVMKDQEGAERLVGAWVSEDYFRVLPEPVAVGRPLAPGDWAADAPGVVVLSWQLWQRHFGGDRSAVGRTVTLGDRAYTVIGVMPPDFTYPTWAGFWAPISTILATDAALGQRGVHVDSRVVGRLRQGVDSATGQQALSALAARAAQAYPVENGGWRSAALVPVASEILGDTGPQLRLLTVAAAIVLLIACVNVAGLALARAGRRARELAIRTALGGGRSALIRLLAAEAVVLGALAAGAGLGLALLVLRWVRVAARELLPRTNAVAVDPIVLSAAALLAVVVVIALGVLPALRPAGPLTATLREGLGGGVGPSRRRLRATLVAGEIALALVLLTGAGLLVRSLIRLQRVPTGLDVDRLAAVPIEPPSPRYDAPERALQLYREVAAAVAAVPGVRSVALTNSVPLSGASMSSAIEVDGVSSPGDESDEVIFREVDSAYFHTAGIPIVRGRAFTSDEIAHPGTAALVNQALAARYWPGGDPIGKRITVYKSAQGRADFGQPVRVTVVGVAGNVRHFSLDTDFSPEVYLPYTITVWPHMSLLVRSGGDPGTLLPAVERAVRNVDPDLPLEGAYLGFRVYSLSDSLREGLAYRRFITGLLAAFALPAVLLAALGIYGVVAYLVAQRSRELGIRMALGARPSDVLRLVLNEGFRLAGIGIVIGAAGAAVSTRWLRSQLYETSPFDPMAFGVAAGLLLAVALVATVLPARRATAIDPARSLQGD